MSNNNANQTENANAVETAPVQPLTAKDFQSAQEVKWCAGCGDYSVLAQMQRVSPGFDIPREKFVWVSGIGCSSRFPYYMDTFGFHGIHGRAAAIATGVKMANPELSVWVATGDGDLLSIGGNHFIHTCRRNVDIKILLFNNRIYGLTKGQYSPTSEKGKRTKSSPYGSVDYPFNPPSVAIGAGVSFFARTIDREPKHMQEMMNRAAKHSGTALIEILQNCSIFNDGAYFALTEKETKEDLTIVLEHGKPLVFGKNRDKGIKLDGVNPVIVDLSAGDVNLDDLWIHDEFDKNPAKALLLAEFAEFPGFPTPIGVFRQINKPPYDELVEDQIEMIQAKEQGHTLEDLFELGNIWEVGQEAKTSHEEEE